MRRLLVRSAGIACSVALWSCMFGGQLFASLLRPIMRAATSKNGRFLVVETLELGPEGEGRSRA